MKTAATVLAAALLAVAGQAVAASTATDPVIGSWKITRGGSGTVKVFKIKGIYAVTARTGVRLGCLRVAKRDLVGFVELPSRTNLPKGVYSANFGEEGRGCNYAVRLRLSGGTITGKVTYSEEHAAGGPFAFRRTG
jgi:hypothetical protein